VYRTARAAHGRRTASRKAPEGRGSVNRGQTPGNPRDDRLAAGTIIESKSRSRDLEARSGEIPYPSVSRPL